MLVGPQSLKWVTFRHTYIQKLVLRYNTAKLIVMGDHRVSQSCDRTCLLIALFCCDHIGLNLVILDLSTSLHDLLTVDTGVCGDVWLLEFVFESYHRWYAWLSIGGCVHICSHGFGSVVDWRRRHEFNIIAFFTIVNIIVSLKFMFRCSTTPMFINLYISCLVSWLNRARSVISKLEVTFCHALLLQFLEFKHVTRCWVLCEFCFMDWLGYTSFMTKLEVARVDVDTRLGLLCQSIVGSLVDTPLINRNLLWLGWVVILCTLMSKFDTVLVWFCQIRLIFI